MDGLLWFIHRVSTAVYSSIPWFSKITWLRYALNPLYGP